MYRGLINDQLQFNDRYPPMLTYLSRFDSLHFLCVFFNFHTDEDRAHTYGAIDPLGTAADVVNRLTVEPRAQWGTPRSAQGFAEPRGIRPARVGP